MTVSLQQQCDGDTTEVWGELCSWKGDGDPDSVGFSLTLGKVSPEMFRTGGRSPSNAFLLLSAGLQAGLEPWTPPLNAEGQLHGPPT